MFDNARDTKFLADVFNEHSMTQTTLYSGNCPFCYNGPLTRHVKLRVAHAPGMQGTFFRRHLQRKPLVSTPGLYKGTYVTHVSWCMSGSLICGCGENVPGIPSACTTRDFTYLTRGPWRTYSSLHGSDAGHWVQHSIIDAVIDAVIDGMDIHTFLVAAEYQWNIPYEFHVSLLLFNITLHNDCSVLC